MRVILSDEDMRSKYFVDKIQQIFIKCKKSH